LFCLVALPAGVVVGLEPLHRLVDSLLEGDELELWEVGAQLGVAGGLLELPVRLGGVEDQLALEVHGLGDGVGDVGDGHLILLSNLSSKQKEEEKEKEKEEERRRNQRQGSPGREGGREDSNQRE